MALLGTLLPSLPDEVLTLVCQELGRDRDFATLFRCAQGSRSLADPALRTLYQFHEQSQSFLQSDEIEIRRGGDFRTRAAEAIEAHKQWTVLWRSIILSSLDGDKASLPGFNISQRFLITVDLQALLPLPKNAGLPES